MRARASSTEPLLMPILHSDFHWRFTASLDHCDPTVVSCLKMLNFLVIGDWGRRGQPQQRSVARGLARAARRTQARFIVSTGDNFYEDGVEGLDDPHWQESFESVYTAAGVRIPWHIALGNHDYRGNVEAQIAYSQASPVWNLPSRYHSFTRMVGFSSQALFVFLDTSPFLERYRTDAERIANVDGEDADAQAEWLKRTLRSSCADWKVVVGHHPILSGSPYHGSSEELHRRIRPILIEYGARVYFSGHEHDLQHLRDDAMDYVISGAGSEWRESGRTAHSLFNRAGLGFAEASLTPERLKLRFCDDNGRVLYKSSLRLHCAEAELDYAV